MYNFLFMFHLVFCFHLNFFISFLYSFFFFPPVVRSSYHFPMWSRLLAPFGKQSIELDMRETYVFPNSPWMYNIINCYNIADYKKKSFLCRWHPLEVVTYTTVEKYVIHCQRTKGKMMNGSRIHQEPGKKLQWSITLFKESSHIWVGYRSGFQNHCPISPALVIASQL